MCVCVYARVCLCVSIIYICKDYVYVFVYIYVCVCMFVCMCMCACVCVCVCTHRSTDSWQLLRRLSGHTGSVLSLAVCGAFLVSSSDDYTIRLWDPQRDWQECCAHAAHDDSVSLLAILGHDILRYASNSRPRFFLW